MWVGALENATHGNVECNLTVMPNLNVLNKTKSIHTMIANFLLALQNCA